MYKPVAYYCQDCSSYDCDCWYVARIKELEDELEEAKRYQRGYKVRLSSHMKGEGCKRFCISCTKPIWFVDDEPLVCPFCGTEGFHVPDIDAEQIMIEENQ